MKETIIQFGEGGFLRSFVDFFIHQMNTLGLYDGKIVVVQPIEQGLVATLNEQKGIFHQFLRGVHLGKVTTSHTKVTSISRGINPYIDYNSFLELAHNRDARLIVSNTTEAGIEYLGIEHITDAPPKSFPAKLTILLYERFKLNLPGFIILSCELIDHNADLLKQYVLKYAALWELEEDFITWITQENKFCNTLVDRICTGYPSEEAMELSKEIGEVDKLMNTAEIFHLWVIEGNFEQEFPFQAAGCNIIWTNDVSPYKKRKVRILNGGHTSMVLAAHLYGLDTVGECMKDEVVSEFLRIAMFDEIIPTLGNQEIDIQFGKDVMERFSNPYVNHKLLSIALNSISKYKVRVLPTILEFYEQNGYLPECLTFSMAALIYFYQIDTPNDTPEMIEIMRHSSVNEILKNTDLWDADVSFLQEKVNSYYKIIEMQGMKEALERLLLHFK